MLTREILAGSSGAALQLEIGSVASMSRPTQRSSESRIR